MFDYVGRDIALGRPTNQSAVHVHLGTPMVSGFAVDGNDDGNYEHKTCADTYLTSQPWWYVDLGVATSVKDVIIANRADCCGK